MTRTTASVTLLRVTLAANVAVLSATCQSVHPATWHDAVERTKRNSPEARIVVLDVTTGRILAAHRLDEGSRTLAAPGSTLKPLVLYSLLAAGRWNAENRVACSRDLVVAGHRLACSHPQAPAFDAHEALTWSCNTYFATVARSLTPGELGRLLRRTGLLGSTALFAPEATADFREPHTIEEEQLTVLGVSGIRVTPLELATAYRWLALEMASHPESLATHTVQAGLRDSAKFGMAGEANVGDISIGGKTGTAEGAATSRTHGWFVGFAPAQKPSVVIAVYLPAAHGADAARIAGAILSNAPLEH
jgi:cell division protein FtsI/penicillin-binding protein 2